MYFIFRISAPPSLEACASILKPALVGIALLMFGLPTFGGENPVSIELTTQEGVDGISLSINSELGINYEIRSSETLNQSGWGQFITAFRGYDATATMEVPNRVKETEFFRIDSYDAQNAPAHLGFAPVSLSGVTMLMEVESVADGHMEESFLYMMGDYRPDIAIRVVNKDGSKSGAVNRYTGSGNDHRSFSYQKTSDNEGLLSYRTVSGWTEQVELTFTNRTAGRFSLGHGYGVDIEVDAEGAFTVQSNDYNPNVYYYSAEGSFFNDFTPEAILGRTISVVLTDSVGPLGSDGWFEFKVLNEGDQYLRTTDVPWRDSFDFGEDTSGSYQYIQFNNRQSAILATDAGEATPSFAMLNFHNSKGGRIEISPEFGSDYRYVGVFTIE